MTTLHIKIDADTKEKLKERARAMSESVGVKINLSEYVRMILKHKVNDEEINDTDDVPVPKLHGY